MPGAAAPLRAHHSRLEALWELSLHDDNTPEKQLRLLLEGAVEALGCAYASLDHAEEGILIAVRRGAENERPADSLLTLANNREEPLMVFSTAESQKWSQHPIVTDVPLGSVLVWPFTGRRKGHALIFGWAAARDTFIDNEEVGYIEFLTQIVIRLMEIAERERELSARVVTDPLTGLYNRAATLDHIALAVAAAERSGVQVAICYIDLDGFKTINDTYGHAFGDAALTETAHRMRSVLRKHEIAGRIGGDEFALLISSFHSESELVHVVRRVQQALGEPVDFGGTAASVRASIGIAIFPADGKTPEELLMHADAAMYHAKRQQGSGYAFYGASHGTRSLEAPRGGSAPAPRGDMEGQLLLCYQPIVDARTGRPIAAQALLRRLHPDAGLLPPSDFLDAAQQQYGNARIDEWVIANAMRRLAHLQRPDRRLTMHISIGEADDQLLQLLKDAPVNLCIEIAEDVVACDPQRYVAFSAACKERGIGLGLANFGCGGLSLRYLAALSLEFVKIGASLMPAATDEGSPSGRAVIETAHRFGWRAIASCVESERQQRWLAANGIDALQGYFVCSPLTDADFESWLRYKNGFAAKDQSA